MHIRKAVCALSAGSVLLAAPAALAEPSDASKTTEVEPSSQDSDAHFRFEKNSDSDGVLNLTNARLSLDDDEVNIESADGEVLETLPRQFWNGEEVVGFTYKPSADGKTVHIQQHSLGSNEENLYEDRGAVRCVLGTAGGAIAGGVGGALAGGAEGSIIPGAGTVAGAVGYGTASAIGSGALAAAGAC